METQLLWYQYLYCIKIFFAIKPSVRFECSQTSRNIFKNLESLDIKKQRLPSFIELLRLAHLKFTQIFCSTAKVYVKLNPSCQFIDPLIDISKSSCVISRSMYIHSNKSKKMYAKNYINGVILFQLKFLLNNFY